MQELEEAGADPARENRIRSLVGEDPTPAKLSKKIEKVWTMMRMVMIIVIVVMLLCRLFT